MALVPDALINPPERARTALPDVLGVLEASGYGVLQLPPKGGHGLLLAVIADQVAEYAHHGYAVVAVGVRGEPGRGAALAPTGSAAATSGRGTPASLPSSARSSTPQRGSAVSRLPGRLTICRQRSSAAGACSGPPGRSNIRMQGTRERHDMRWP